MKRSNKSKSSRGLILAIGVLAVAGIALWYTNSLEKFSADSGSTATGSISLVIENKYNLPIPTAYYNGTDPLNVSVDVSNGDGTPMLNAPLKYVKSDNVKVAGPTNSGNGHIDLVLTSTKDEGGSFKVKLAQDRDVFASARIRFKGAKDIENTTDKTAFVAGAPLVLSAEIEPWMVGHLKSAKANYKYSTLPKLYGIFPNKKTESVDLSCTENKCQAIIGADLTTPEKTLKGKFRYQFVIVDEKGNTTQSESYEGELK